MKLEEIRAICEAATEGPWEQFTNYTDDGRLACGTGPWHEMITIKNRPDLADAAFIAMSRTVLPKLLKVVEMAQAMVDIEMDTTQGLRKALAELEATE